MDLFRRVVQNLFHTDTRVLLGLMLFVQLSCQKWDKGKFMWGPEGLEGKGKTLSWSFLRNSSELLENGCVEGSSWILWDGKSIGWGTIEALLPMSALAMEAQDFLKFWGFTSSLIYWIQNFFCRLQVPRSVQGDVTCRGKLSTAACLYALCLEAEQQATLAKHLWLAWTELSSPLLLLCF